MGCGFTAQLGAMRICEEIDALEVMAIPSLPFLVTTRIIAGLIAVIPLYIVGLLSSYFATRLVVTRSTGSTGTYDHYFHLFLPPGDVLWSFGKVLIFAVVIILIHCYHGYHAKGGPAGVGVAVGRAVRTSIVAINVIDLLLSHGHLGDDHDRQDGRVMPIAHDAVAARQVGMPVLVSRPRRSSLLLLRRWLTYAVFNKAFADVVQVDAEDHHGRDSSSPSRRT